MRNTITRELALLLKEKDHKEKLKFFQEELMAALALLGALNEDEHFPEHGFNPRKMAKKIRSMAREYYLLADNFSKNLGIQLPINCAQSVFLISLEELKAINNTFFKSGKKESIDRAEKDFLRLAENPSFSIDDEKFKGFKDEINLVLKKHYREINGSDEKLFFHNRIHSKSENKTFYNPFAEIINEAKRRDRSFRRSLFVKKVRLRAAEKYELALKMNISDELANVFEFKRHKGKTAILLRLLHLSLSYVDECYKNGRLKKGDLSKAGQKTNYQEWHDRHLADAKRHLLELVKRDGVDPTQINLNFFINDEKLVTLVLEDLKRNVAANKEAFQNLNNKFKLRFEEILRPYRAVFFPKEKEEAATTSASARLEPVNNNNNSTPSSEPNLNDDPVPTVSFDKLPDQNDAAVRKTAPLPVETEKHVEAAPSKIDVAVIEEPVTESPFVNAEVTLPAQSEKHVEITEPKIDVSVVEKRITESPSVNTETTLPAQTEKHVEITEPKIDVAIVEKRITESPAVNVETTRPAQTEKLIETAAPKIDPAVITKPKENIADISVDAAVAKKPAVETAPANATKPTAQPQSETKTSAVASKFQVRPAGPNSAPQKNSFFGHKYKAGQQLIAPPKQVVTPEPKVTTEITRDFKSRLQHFQGKGAVILKAENQEPVTPPKPPKKIIPINKEELFKCRTIGDFRSKLQEDNFRNKAEACDKTRELLAEWRKQAPELAEARRALSKDEDLAFIVEETKQHYKIYLQNYFDTDYERSEAIDYGNNNLLITIRNQERATLLELSTHEDFEYGLTNWYLTLFVDSDDASKTKARAYDLRKQWRNQYKVTETLLQSPNFDKFEENFVQLQNTLGIIDSEKMKQELLAEWRNPAELYTATYLDDFNIRVTGFIKKHYDVAVVNVLNLAEELRNSWREAQFENHFGCVKLSGLKNGLAAFIDAHYEKSLDESEKERLSKALWDKWRNPKKQNLMKAKDEQKFESAFEIYEKEAGLDKDNPSLKAALLAEWKAQYRNAEENPQQLSL